MNFKAALSGAKTFVTSSTGRQLLKVQKNSPALLMGVGVVGFVGTVVVASKATLKLSETLDTYDDKLETARTLFETGHKDYSQKDFNHDVRVLRVRTAYQVAKLYAPAFGLGVATLSCFGGSHIIMTKRNAGLAAAYAAVDKAFEQYRERVANEFGEEKERELRYDIVTEEVHDTENGKVEKVKKANGRSIYARVFDETTSTSWSKEPRYNQVFLQAQQNYANDLLRQRGHVFLNDVFDMLGLERTPAGAVVGWVKGNGDDYIDFGIFEGDRFKGMEFVAGNEKSVVLDFNVDGVIYSLI